MAVTSAGTIILAYSSGEFHGAHGSGCPAVSVSSDDGDSFSEPSILQEFAPGQTYTHCGNLALGVTNDDVIILMAMAYRDNEANSIFGWTSIDQGTSWQEINVSALAASRTGSVYGHIFFVPNRGYAVCGHYRSGSYPKEQGLWISFSQDGLHWNAPEHITDEPLVEPAVICTGEDLIGLIRNTDSDQRNRYRSLRASRRRMDWQLNPSPIASDGGTILPSPHIVQDVNDPSRLLALQTERSAATKTPGAIRLWTSTDQGVSWAVDRTLVDVPHLDGDPNTDFGYPWMVQREDGPALMAFYHGQQKGPCSIWGLDFEW